MEIPVRFKAPKSWIDYPSRAALKAAALDAMHGQSKVRAAVIEGQPGSGRSGLLDQICTLAPVTTFQVVRLRLTGGVPTLQAPGVIDRAIDLSLTVGATTTKAGLIASILAVPGAHGIGAAGRSIQGVALQARRQRELGWHGIAEPKIAFDLITEFAKKPLLVLIDDFDDADRAAWWWYQFIVPTIQLVRNAQQGAVFVAARARPTTEALLALGDSRESFDVWSLAPLDNDDVGALVGRATKSTQRVLLSASNGLPGAMGIMWREMRRLKAVEQRDGIWEMRREFNSLESLPLRVKLVDRGADADTAAIEAILAAGAIEGRIFTLEVISDVLGLPLEYVLETCNTLAAETSNSASVLTFVEKVGIPGGRPVSRYAFSDPDDAALAAMFHSSMSAADLALSIAGTMVKLYGPSVWMVARACSRLFSDGRDSERAKQYANVAEQGLDSASALKQLEHLLSEAGARLSRQRDGLPLYCYLLRQAFWAAQGVLRNIAMEDFSNPKTVDLAEQIAAIAGRSPVRTDYLWATLDLSRARRVSGCERQSAIALLDIIEPEVTLSDPSLHATYLFERGLHALDDGSMDAAFKYFTEVASLAAGSVALHTTRAQALIKLAEIGYDRQSPEAAHFLAEAVAMGDEVPMVMRDAWKLLARVQADRRDPAARIGYLDLLISSYVSDGNMADAIDQLLERGKDWLALGNIEACLLDVRQIISFARALNSRLDEARAIMLASVARRQQARISDANLLAACAAATIADGRAQQWDTTSALPVAVRSLMPQATALVASGQLDLFLQE